jgi:hypothetical protein
MKTNVENNNIHKKRKKKKQKTKKTLSMSKKLVKWFDITDNRSFSESLIFQSFFSVK